MRNWRCAVKQTGFITLALATLGVSAFAKELPTEKAILTAPPLVPPPITRSHPAKVIVEMEVIEKVAQIADGVDYTFWTFGGTVPGKFIRVRAGDTVEFHLGNHPNNRLPHNIDLHAVTGPGGGAASSYTAPGHKSRFSFKALNPGLYIYHCATAPVGMHVANGMYGLIYVQPEDPLPAVDKEFYIVQGDFYTKGDFGVKGNQPFSMKRAIDENPSYVVFNGSASSLVGDNTLQTKVGEKVRLFIGNGGPNLVSSFHVIGEIFDKVYFEGGAQSQDNVQTTLVPAGGSAIVEFKMDVPGTYILVDHSLFRAFNKGAVGMLKADGEQDKLVYTGKEVDESYLGDESIATNLKANPQSPNKGGQIVQTEKTKIDGKTLFANNCAMCHQASGEGIAGVFPPLAKSDFLMKIAKLPNRAELVQIVLQGKSGKVVVNGKEYNGVMTPISGLDDQDIANVLTFVTNTWGNQAKSFSVDEIKSARASLKKAAPVGGHE